MPARPCEHFRVHIPLITAVQATKKEASAAAMINPKSLLICPPFPVTKGREFQDFLWKKATYPPHLH